MFLGPIQSFVLMIFPWFGKCCFFSLVGNQACFVLWQLLLAAPTFEALVRILPGRNPKYQCWMILAPQMETNCVCFGHGPQALLLALQNGASLKQLLVLPQARTNRINKHGGNCCINLLQSILAIGLWFDCDLLGEFRSIWIIRSFVMHPPGKAASSHNKKP